MSECKKICLINSVKYEFVSIANDMGFTTSVVEPDRRMGIPLKDRLEELYVN